MNKYLITLSFLLCIQVIVAQNIFKGTVIDNETKQGIPFASVYLPQLEKGASTDESGAFEITNIPAGSYKLVVSVLGFATFSKNVDITTGNNTLQISLEPSAVEIEQVIVSTPFHKLQSENVMKVSQKSLTQMQQQGANTLIDGIATIPGVNSVSTGTAIGKPVIRGLSSNRVLVYTQNIRLENQQFGGEHGLGLNDNGVESVEVIKGPASLLYGSDALGGVLYINPERFADAGTTQGSLSSILNSNTNGLNLSAGAKTSGNSFKFLARGSFVSHEDYKIGGGDRVTNTRFKEYDFKTGVGYQKNNFKTDLRYNYNNSLVGIPEGIEEQSAYRTPLEPYQDLQTHILSSKTNFFFKNSSLDATFGFVANKRQEFEGHHHHEEGEAHEEEEEAHEEEHAALDMQLNTFSYNVAYNLAPIGKLETVFGVQGMVQTNKNHGEETLIPNASTDDFGVFVTSHIHLKNNDIQLGLRYDNRNIATDHHEHDHDHGDVHEDEIEVNRSFNSFNASAGLRTELAPKLVTRINLATGFRAPNLSELTSNGAHHGANRYEIGNPDLKSEQNIQMDFSIELKSKHIEMYVNAFYNKVANFIYLQPDGTLVNAIPVFHYHQDDAKLYGGEIGFHFHPHSIEWLHYESSYEGVIGKQDNGDYIPLIPANVLTNTFRAEINQGFLSDSYAFITLQNILKQDKPGLFETASSGYSLLNIGIGKTFSSEKNPVKIWLSANNLLDKTYISHLSRLKSDGISNMGRNITLGVSLTL
ncbi:TonB-dependent receptor [Imtechella halotolerans]|uniref:TonB-dependent outer membrane receptor n=1 Tax=Imtechella halotolerans K1 TaxID=946077 RepID=I0W786_9FLAO|nr:TonB-dependent receptor [Imtechella halotolerans]EID72252.1 TonB-dependent outer membrane receptor [Imtechella halotolerans K1]WMQ64355.1 TonB-dependent receptor [Imtechella halotolerans]